MKTLHRKLILLFVCSTLAPLMSAVAATPPYFEDFESYPIGDTTVTNFTEVDSDAWTIVAPSFSGQAYQNEISAFSPGIGTAAAENSSAVVQFPALGRSAFYLATSFVIDSLVLAGADENNTAFMGLVARATDSSPASSGGDRYQVSYYLDDDGLGHPTARLYLSEHNLFFGDSLNILSTSSLPVVIGDLYMITFEAKPVGSALRIRAILTNVDTSTSIMVSGTDSSNILTGTYFGYFNNVRVEDGGTVALNADFDDFTARRTRPH